MKVFSLRPVVGKDGFEAWGMPIDGGFVVVANEKGVLRQDGSVWVVNVTLDEGGFLESNLRLRTFAECLHDLFELPFDPTGWAGWVVVNPHYSYSLVMH